MRWADNDVEALRAALPACPGRPGPASLPQQAPRPATVAPSSCAFYWRRAEQILALKCGAAGSMTVNLETGRVYAHLVLTTTDPGSAAVAGFWMVPVP